MAAFLEEYARIPAAVDEILALPDGTVAAAVQAIAKRAGRWASIAVGRALRRRPALLDWPGVRALPETQRALRAAEIHSLVESDEETLQDRFEEGPVGIAYYDIDVELVKDFEPYFDTGAPDYWFEAVGIERPELLPRLMVDDNEEIRSSRCEGYVSSSMKRIMSNEAVQQRFVDAASTTGDVDSLLWFRDLLGADVPLKCKAPDYNEHSDPDTVRILKTMFVQDGSD